MPSISTMVYPAPGYVRVETNWADVDWATGVKVERVDCETGARVPLRPYVSYEGDYLTLSCGYAIFWDTEPQLDRCVYYCATAIDAAGNVVTTPAAYLASDDFNRVNVDTWNTASDGVHVWSLAGGTVGGNYDVNGTKGTQTNDSVGILRQSTVDVGKTGMGVQVNVSINTVATGANGSAWLLLNGADLNNYYIATISFTTGANVTLNVGKREGGSLVLGGATGALGTYGVGTEWTVKAEAVGSQIRAKAWPAIGPEPTEWTLTLPTSALTTQGNLAGLLSRRETGNTDSPMIFAWDNFTVYDPCADPVTIETCSQDLIVPSGGMFRLGDPVRPCNDVAVTLSANVDPNCVPSNGVFFRAMDDETFGANSGTFQPINAVHPIVVSRARRSVESTLRLVTKTFEDRDAVRALNAPGSPLLLRGPSPYGIEDRYMAVGDVGESRGMSDHRFQARTVGLPHVAVARPSGPTQGVCGTRIADLCGTTWDEAEAADLTWADILRGKVSTLTPLPASDERTWSEVNAEYADWNAVNAGNDDWDDLLDGAA